MITFVWLFSSQLDNDDGMDVYLKKDEKVFWFHHRLFEEKWSTYPTPTQHELWMSGMLCVQKPRKTNIIREDGWKIEQSWRDVLSVLLLNEVAWSFILENRRGCWTFRNQQHHPATSLSSQSVWKFFHLIRFSLSHSFERRAALCMPNITVVVRFCRGYKWVVRGEGW